MQELNVIKAGRHFYAAGWWLVYVAKWPVMVGVPLLYTFSAFEANWMLNSVWVISATAILWDCIVISESKNRK